jgi:hypothetical protein
MIYDVKMFVAFFDSENELLLRIEREYTVEAETPEIARQMEVTKLARVLVIRHDFRWSTATFDVTVLKKGKEIHA